LGDGSAGGGTGIDVALVVRARSVGDQE